MFKLAHFRFYVNFSRLMGGCLFLLIFNPLQAFSRYPTANSNPLKYHNFYDITIKNKQILAALKGKNEKSCKNVKGTTSFVIVFLEPRGSEPHYIFPVYIQGPDECQHVSRDMVGSVRKCKFSYISSNSFLNFDNKSAKNRQLIVKGINSSNREDWKATTWINPSSGSFRLSTSQEPFMLGSTKSPCEVGLALGLVERIQPRI